MAHVNAELPLPFQTIVTAFLHLKEAVRIALQTQLGDEARLQEQIQICLQLQQSIMQVHNLTFRSNHVMEFLFILAPCYYSTRG